MYANGMRTARPSAHKGWYSRGYLPHFDSPGMLQGLTYRLADSLPADVVAMLIADAELMENPAKRMQLEAFLNAGYGACHLRDPEIGRIVETSLLHFDGERYRMIAWVVMPNHVHTLVETFDEYPLHKIVQTWKSYTVKQANQVLERRGQFWALDYFDRYIRDERHFWAAVNYIHNNPVKAGLVKEPEAWLLSSAAWWNANGSFAGGP